jgi:DNA mismatch endonuclease (patch repair protein)
MARVRAKNTGPELFVRRLLFSLGYRYRLHCATLPGRPDLVFPAQRKVIFVHGCLWHRHGCAADRPPRSRRRFWESKLEGNKRRDKIHVRTLKCIGWRVLVVWECELADKKLLPRLIRFLES